MPAEIVPSSFWVRWLQAVAVGVIAFGLLLVLAPGLARQGFSLLVYADTAGIDAFGDTAVRYVGLTHAVIGGLMVGWGTAMLYAVRVLFARGRAEGWTLITLSITAWYLPDTAYSLLSGFWQNAVLNTVFLTLFVLPLWATRAMRG